MYILLNRDALTINYKHSVPSTLCNIAWIELQTCGYTVAPCDPSAFRGLTEMELKMLYRNVTGKELGLNGLNACLEVLTSLIVEMEESEICPIQAELQAACVNEGQKGFYKYVFGALKPALVADLFNKAYNAQSNPEVERLAEQGVWPLLTSSYKAQQSAPAAPQQAQAAKPVQRTSTPPKEPGATTTSGKIWALADHFWADHGRSTIKHDLDYVKKLVVNDLLAQGVNRSTITTQLSHWQKNRAPL
jgi:hypothetical protein